MSTIHSRLQVKQIYPSCATRAKGKLWKTEQKSFPLGTLTKLFLRHKRKSRPYARLPTCGLRHQTSVSSSFISSLCNPIYTQFLYTSLVKIRDSMLLSLFRDENKYRIFMKSMMRGTVLRSSIGIQYLRSSLRYKLFKHLLKTRNTATLDKIRP